MDIVGIVEQEQELQTCVAEGSIAGTIDSFGVSKITQGVRLGKPVLVSSGNKLEPRIIGK